MVEYKVRLQKAMDASSVSTSALAAELKISYQAVKKVVDGMSSAFTASNNSKAAAFLKVRPDWLATGTGAMRASDTEGMLNSEQPANRTHGQSIQSLVTALAGLSNEGRERAATLLQSLARDPDGPWAEWLISLLDAPETDAVRPAEAPTTTIKPNASNNQLGPALRDALVVGGKRDERGTSGEAQKSSSG